MPDATRTLIHAFIGSQLDYSYSILAGVSSQLIQKLQVVQNAATHLPTQARKCGPMTPALCELIGYQFDSGSGSRLQFWHTSVNMVWRGPAIPEVILCAGHRHLRSAQILRY